MRPLPDWYEKFRIMKEYGRDDFVEKEILTKIESDENNPFLYEFLGDIYLNKGDIEKAKESYLKSVNIFKSQNEYQRAIVVLHKEKKLDNSMENIKEYADLLLKAGLKERARQYYIDVMKKFAEEEKVEQIIEIMKRIIELYPANLDLKIIMSKILIMQNKIEQAKDMLLVELNKAEERRDIGAIEKINEVLDNLEATNE